MRRGEIQNSASRLPGASSAAISAALAGTVSGSSIHGPGGPSGSCGKGGSSRGSAVAVTTA